VTRDSALGRMDSIVSAKTVYYWIVVSTDGQGRSLHAGLTCRPGSVCHCLRSLSQPWVTAWSTDWTMSHLDSGGSQRRCWGSISQAMLQSVITTQLHQHFATSLHCDITTLLHHNITILGLQEDLRGAEGGAVQRCVVQCSAAPCGAVTRGSQALCGLSRDRGSCTPQHRTLHRRPGCAHRLQAHHCADCTFTNVHHSTQ
jgi:hypothetical protein